ncbi:MAG TPA: hypothetical protein PLI45_00305 [Candidatus Woesebacteria bacterium]|nr:hypothetical protein [Candidatus Woesebacteria bacterium]
MTEITFSAINNVFHIIQNHGFLIGRNRLKPTLDTFVFATEHPTNVYIFEQNVKRILGCFRVTRYQLVAHLRLMDDEDKKIWWLFTSLMRNDRNLDRLEESLFASGKIPGMASVLSSPFPFFQE